MVWDFLREWALVALGAITAGATATTAYFALLSRRPVIQCTIGAMPHGGYRARILVMNNQRHTIIVDDLAIQSPKNWRIEAGGIGRAEVAPGKEQRFDYGLAPSDDAVLPASIKLKLSISDQLPRRRIKTYTIRRTIKA